MAARLIIWRLTVWRLSGLATLGAILLGQEMVTHGDPVEGGRARNAGQKYVRARGALGETGEGAPLALECTCRRGNDLARIAVIGCVLRQSSEQSRLVGLEQ